MRFVLFPSFMSGSISLRLALPAALALALILGCSDDKTTTPPLGDTTPPQAVADLTGHLSGKTTVALTWTESGDDGLVGRAHRCEVRYANAPITMASWEEAETVASTPSPAAGGAIANCRVLGLESNTTYYFALRTCDEVPNWSGLSNVIKIRTLGKPKPIPVQSPR